MPGLTGLELCRNIRAHTPGGYTYFIIVTSRGTGDQIVEGMTAGADDYLVKPLDPESRPARRAGDPLRAALLPSSARHRSVKSYNDMYGHQAGDQVLKAVAAELKTQVRGGDALYRYGGEEFLCIFPEQSLETATVATQRMRRGLERLAIRT
jgi:PleD family two-component response regulator